MIAANLMPQNPLEQLIYSLKKLYNKKYCSNNYYIFHMFFILPRLGDAANILKFS